MHKEASHPAGYKLVIGNTYSNLLFYLVLNSFKKRVSKPLPGKVELLSSQGFFLSFPQSDFGTASTCLHSSVLRLTVLDQSSAWFMSISHLSSSFFIQTAKVHCSHKSLKFSVFFFLSLVSLKLQTTFFLAFSRLPAAFEFSLTFLAKLLSLLVLLTSHHHQPPQTG